VIIKGKNPLETKSAATREELKQILEKM